MEKETIIISLGGSLIVPEEINIGFLGDLKKLILSEVEKGKRFAIITGGGKTARNYQNAAKDIANPTNEELDWLGIGALKLNALLVKVLFTGFVHNEVIEDLTKDLTFSEPIVIGSALEVGHSTDYDAVLAAKSLGAKKIINMSNIDYVYDADPKTNPDAKKIENISWSDYMEIIPKEWNPGLNSPFDPIASEMAGELGLEVVIMNGNLDNLAKYLSGEKFEGTVIQ